jgi:hypothetical protein
LGLSTRLPRAVSIRRPRPASGPFGIWALARLLLFLRVACGRDTRYDDAAAPAAVPTYSLA